MASFWEVLKKVGSVAMKVEQIAEPMLTAIDPPLGNLISGWVGKIQGAVVKVEAMNPNVAGPDKLAMAENDIALALAAAQNFMPAGKKLTYDPVKLKAAIDANVAAFNAAAEFKKSLKIEDI